MRSGLLIFCRKIIFEDKRLLNEKGPLLLACNHPNSFFDALILGAHFRQPVHFLARGDVFKNPLAKKILTALKAIPIYRLSEGKEYLALNDATFEKCTEILLKGGIVLIFSEGLCINQWKLRQLKKGTARIALNAWKQPGIASSFNILPVSLNYSSFTRFRKSVIINFGRPIKKNNTPTETPEGEQITELNKLIYSRLEKGVITGENDKSLLAFLLSNFSFFKGNDKELIPTLKAKQSVLNNNCGEYFDRLHGTKKVALKTIHRFMCLLLIPVLFIPAIIGFAIHLPLYFPLNNLIKKKTEGTVYYHSA
ncbi:MAG: phospholipid/glycerol acyltransferase, partial [Segetibacter sp.]|nr:phospholipid/glycerol acyltransferase [Segetibacter sp.]